MPKMNIESYIGSTPKYCDICDDEFGVETTDRFVDGKTKSGPWALMCETCHEDFGVGLGVGCGQLYDLYTLVKLDG